ncbi:MAG: hypothetical protein Q4F66_06560 [Clostridium sp.]|nr:hypothetical protein [Clostridium sp.]
MNRGINKFTVLLAAAVLSSIPCAASADAGKTVQNQAQEVTDSTKNDVLENTPQNEIRSLDTEIKSKEEDNKSEIGWKKNNDESYSLIDGKGNMIKSDWCKVGGKWYYFDENGIMQKGWIKSDGNWYCLDTNGNPKNGWVSERNNWYYFNGDGAMEIGWNTIGGSWYYFNEKGEMASGWQNINSKWYYFDNSGKMLSNTVIDGCTLGPKGDWV